MKDKILFISDEVYPDYMSDTMFHGGRSVLGESFIDSKRINFMYDDYCGYRNLYGRGFTLYGKLDSKLEIDREDIENKIKDKYFKTIMYGSCRRKLEYLELVRKSYSKNEIIFIDGEDHQGIDFTLANYGNYFKRELLHNPKNIIPIQFAIPKENIIKCKPTKTNEFGTVIPYKKETYIFHDEKSYFEDYQKSYYGITCKKQGWDCLRHYEIMMNHCFPLFKDIKDCPKMTMVKFPKKKIIKAMHDLDLNKFDYYDEFMEELMEIVANKLTTEKMITYVLNCIKC